MTDSPHKKLILAFDAKRLFNNFTGLGNYSRTLIKNLQHFYPEHEYHLFTPKMKENEETAYFFDHKKFIIHTSSKPLWRTFGVSGIAKKINADIYHGLSHEIPLNLPKKIKSIVTFHDLIYEIYPKQFGLWDRKMYKFKYKKSAEKADYIVSISESTKKDLQRLYHVPNDKIYVIPQSCQNVFQTASFEEPKTIINEKNYFLYVGSIIPRKNLLSVVKAFAQLEEAYRKPFIVIGNGPERYMSQIHQEIQKHNLSGWFTFLSHVSNDQLVSLYDQSYALCYPSVYEGFGIPVIESLFRKKPVITSKVSSLPEAVGGGGILIDPHSVEDLVRAFKEISHQTVYSALADAGYQHVSDHFSTKATAQKLMEFYYSVL